MSKLLDLMQAKATRYGGCHIDYLRNAKEIEKLFGDQVVMSAYNKARLTAKREKVGRTSTGLLITIDCLGRVQNHY